MRGRFRESEPLRIVERPLTRAEFWISVLPGCPLPASGARRAELYRGLKYRKSGAGWSFLVGIR
jgi:hypothetical protein